MYLDLDPRAHYRYAAYEMSDAALQIYQDSQSRQYDLMTKEIEQKYSLGKAQIGATIKAASISASASRANAKTAANAAIKVANIGAATTRYGIDVGAAVDREQIANTMAMKKMDIAQAREEMERIGIPQVRIQAWVAQKNYELAKEGIALDILKTDVAYRSSPDRYWMAADFEAALPSLLNGTTLAGGGMNGPTGQPSGAPTPNSLEQLVAQLGGGVSGEAPTTGGAPGSTGNIYEDTLAATQSTGNYGAPGTTGTAGITPQSQKALSDALMANGLQGVGHYPVESMSQGDLDAWLMQLKEGGSGPTDPRIVNIMQVAKQNGYSTNTYDQWMKDFTGAATAAAAPATAPAAAATTSTSPVAGYSSQDATMLSGIAASLKNGLDPFVMDKLDPTQRAILLSGAARLGYDPNTLLWGAEAKRPGQGDPLAA